MVIEMTASVCGNYFAYNEGRQYRVPDEVPEARARELIALGRAIIVQPPHENAALQTQAPHRNYSRGPLREARIRR